MELAKCFVKQIIDYSSPDYQPTNYKEMDEWLNAFSYQAWLAILGTYTAGGFTGVIKFLKTTYEHNLVKWQEKDLRHFFNCRNWTDFKTRLERPNIEKAA